MLKRVLDWWRRPRYEVDKLDPAVMAADSSAVMRALARDFLEDRRADRRSGVLKATLYFLMFAVPTVLYIWFALYAGGIRLGPVRDVVGVVRIEGQMAAGTLASADRVNAALRNACESPRVKAIVLSIDSPGGAPVEAERIYRMIEACGVLHSKPIVAVVNNIGASAAYMVALHADRIYAGQYSLVGSVGAIMSGWDLHKAIAKYDVSQRVYASGTLKSMLNPFLPMSPEADKKAKQLVAELGRQFRTELEAARKGKLVAGINYTSGEVWSGQEAQRLGLVDELGTLDDVVKKRWNLPTHDFGPRDSLVPFLSAAAEGLRAALLNQMNAPTLQ